MSAVPNILLITCDQLRPYELACYGGPLSTPALSSLAQRGVLFEHAITNFPVCMSARSILISGQHNRTATGGVTNISWKGRDGDFAMPEYPYARRPHLPDATLAEILRDKGFETAVIGKWHIHSWPHEIGFEHYLIPRVHHAHSAQIFSRDGGAEFSPPGYSTDFEADEVVRFLTERTDERPFFLYYNISPPHCPVADIPERYRTMFKKGDIPLRANADEDGIKNKEYWYKVYRWDFRYYSFHLPHTEDLPEGYDLEALAAEYAGATVWMDDAVGKVLGALKSTGLDTNTLVIFVSDHGENLGSHGLVQKGTENDESLRVPLIMAGPELPAGKTVSNSVASLVDLAPTVLDFVQIPTPVHMHGRSLLPEACGTETELPRDAFFETVEGTGLRTTDMTYFLARNLDRSLQERPKSVFNRSSDPFEFENLAKTGSWPELDQRLRQLDSQFSWSDLESEY